MSKTHKFSVLLWEDAAGRFTATLLTYYPRVSGYGEKAADALGQVKDYLDWAFKNEWITGGPELSDLKLTEFKADLIPKYQDEHRQYSSPDAVVMKVPAVYGKEASGMWVCFLPTLGMVFNFSGKDSLRQLVVHYVQEALGSLSPRELSRYLPPRNPALEEVGIKPKERGQGPVTDEQLWETFSLEELPHVANPLDQRRRKQKKTPVWGRDAEIAQLLEHFENRHAHVLLVGETGCGKSSVLSAAVRKVEREQDEDESREEKAMPRFWVTNGDRLIAGMRYLGQWEQRCEEVIDELGRFGGVLCLENLLGVVLTGGREARDSVAAFLVPYMKRQECRIVAEASPEELDACRRLLPEFAEQFRIMPVEKLSRGEALRALGASVKSLEQNYKLDTEGDVADQVCRLYARFMPYQVLPGGADGFIRRLYQQAKALRQDSVTSGQAVDAFTAQTGLPEAFIRDEVPMAFDDVLDNFQERIIGQEKACRTAAQTVISFKAGVNDPARPVGVLLFCGPTGVGKTALASAVAKVLFGQGDDRDRLIRLDMSEYGQGDAANRLLLSADLRKPSDWLQKVRRQPFSVILLDEVEKADPAVFDILLGMMDEGRLTDRYGRTTIFRSALVIMTSNLGAAQAASLGYEERPPSYEAEVSSFFRPEFFNRIDAVVPFRSLGPEDMQAITVKELGEIAIREGLHLRNLKLLWEEELVESLADAGFDQRYGARPLQRTLERHVVTPLAHFLLSRPKLRDATVRATLEDDGKVTFRIWSA